MLFKCQGLAKSPQKADAQIMLLQVERTNLSLDQRVLLDDASHDSGSLLVFCKALFLVLRFSCYTFMTIPFPHLFRLTFADDSLLSRSINTEDRNNLLQHNTDTLEKWEKSWQNFETRKMQGTPAHQHNTPTHYTTKS